MPSGIMAEAPLAPRPKALRPKVLRPKVLRHCPAARLFRSGLLSVMLLVLISCAGPSTRQDIPPETRRGPLVVTTIGATEFLCRELLRGVAETQLLGPQVPRNQRAEPTPDELVMIERASIIVAYGGEPDRASVAMVRRTAPEKTVLVIREGATTADGFAWLKPANLREDARTLSELLASRFDESRQRARIEANLEALEARLHSLEGTLGDYSTMFGGHGVFTDDRRMHPFLRSLGFEIIHNIDVPRDGEFDDEQRENFIALAANSPLRILLVTHPEKKQHMSGLASEADMTLVYFNPFLDGVTGVGQIDSVISRQLSVLWLALSSSLASAEAQ